MAKANLFEIAKKEVANTKTTSKSKLFVNVFDKLSADKAQDFKSNLDEFLENQKMADFYAAKAGVAKNEVLTTSKEVYLQMYKEKSENPGTFLIGDDESKIMFIPMNKYCKISNVKMFEEKYPEALDEETTFSFNPKLLDKYAKVLSKLILSSKEIDDDDKAKLIEAKVSYFVKDGTIDKLADYHDIKEAFEDIVPVVMLKATEQ